jgi:hypothetical protein
MAAFRDFDPYVLPWVSGAARPAIDDALRQSAIEFCKRTYAVVENFNVKAPAKPELVLASADPNLEVHAALEVYGPAGKLDPATKQKLRDAYPDGWQDETAAAASDLRFWISLGETSIRLVPYLTVATTEKVLLLEVSMRPTVDAAELPDILYTRWPEIIAAGALWRLHSQEGVPWQNLARVPAEMAAFNSGISHAADEVEAGYNRPQLRTGLDAFP